MLIMLGTTIVPVSWPAQNCVPDACSLYVPDSVSVPAGKFTSTVLSLVALNDPASPAVALALIET
jgi:xanthosine utilization system XapX-like protein